MIIPYLIKREDSNQDKKLQAMKDRNLEYN